MRCAKSTTLYLSWDSVSISIQVVLVLGKVKWDISSLEGKDIASPEISSAVQNSDADLYQCALDSHAAMCAPLCDAVCVAAWMKVVLLDEEERSFSNLWQGILQLCTVASCLPC